MLTTRKTKFLARLTFQAPFNDTPSPHNSLINVMQTKAASRTARTSHISKPQTAVTFSATYHKTKTGTGKKETKVAVPITFLMPYRRFYSTKSSQKTQTEQKLPNTDVKQAQNLRHPSHRRRFEFSSCHDCRSVPRKRLAVSVVNHRAPPANPNAIFSFS